MRRSNLAGNANLGDVFHIMWSDASRFIKVRLAAVLLLVIVAAILTALGPIALKRVIDAFAGSATAPTPASLAVLIGLYVLSQWFARTVGELRGLIYARAERRMFRSLCERLFAHVIHLPLQFHLNRQTGAVSQTLDNGWQGYQMILHHLVFTALPVTAELGTIIVVLAHLGHPALLSLFCAALGCYALAFGFAATTTSRAAKMASAAHVEASAVMTDGILNLETVKYFVAEPLVQAKVSEALARTEREWVSFYRRYSVNGLAVATIFAAFLAATILYASSEVVHAHMTVGEFVLINAYMLQVVRPVEMLGYAMQGLAQGVAMLEKMLAVFRESPESLGTDDPAPLAGPAALEFTDVTLSYRPNRVVLNKVSFRIAAGKTLGIVGLSGSGKSSIVRLLVRFFEPDSGHILFDGVPISAVPLAILRRSIAVVPQDAILFNDTIGNNIALGSPYSTQGEIEQAAKLAHLHDFITSLPDRYDTRVGERGAKLSGGEKQRTCIARVAIKRPRIYVFDEATSSLDSTTEREILDNLQEISRGCTTLVIAHRLSAVVHADEIIVLDAGAIAERGTHESLLREQGRYAALWRAQQHSSIAA